MTTPADPLTLAHWRRTVAELYATVRQASPSERAAAWELFRATRDTLFHDHPQTPLSQQQRVRFGGLDYYAYDPAWRLMGTVDRDVEREAFTVELPAEGALRYTRVTRILFSVAGEQAALSAFWIEGYGGGLFLPFRDATSGGETYGGGRYLYDTIKGADLGASGLGAGADQVVLDFNYAYNPSCAYSERWVCPLAPQENRLSFAVQAGEKVFHL